MIYSIPIRNTMRSRIVRDAGIISEKSIQFENMAAPQNKSVWMRETWIGGTEGGHTNISTRQLAIMEYDIFVLLNSGNEEVIQISNQIENEFDLLDPVKSRIAIPGFEYLDVRVYQTSEGTPQQDDRWYWVPLLLYLRIDANPKPPAAG